MNTIAFQHTDKRLFFFRFMQGPWHGEGGGNEICRCKEDLVCTGEGGVAEIKQVQGEFSMATTHATKSLENRRKSVENPRRPLYHRFAWIKRIGVLIGCLSPWMPNPFDPKNNY